MSRLYEDGTILYRVDTATLYNDLEILEYVYDYDKYAHAHILYKDNNMAHVIADDNYVPISLFHNDFKLTKLEVYDQIRENVIENIKSCISNNSIMINKLYEKCPELSNKVSILEIIQDYFK